MNEINTTEDQLRSEIEALRRQLEEQKQLSGDGHPRQPRAPRARTLLLLALLITALVVAGFFLGYLPRQRRELVLAADSKAEGESLPVVNIEPVKRADSSSSLVLPGNIQAVTEAPVLARASGYIKKRYVDIGDRVQAGQVLADLEAPELEQQIRQAQAAVGQANSATEQAQAAHKQALANENLARVTAERYQRLFEQKIASRQDFDNYEAQYEAQQANAQALDKAIAAARSNAAAAEANVARLTQLQDYLTVRAPFAGVITVRNIDTGMLATEGSTLLYRIAQTGTLRLYLNVPQADAGSIRVGQRALLIMSDQQGRKFTGTVARTSQALDPATRTLLVEVQVPNPTGALMPGMYAQVDLAVPRKESPLVIPGDTLVVRSDGPQVAVVAEDGTVHFTRVQLGRDFGDRLEVLAGLREGQQLAVNPSDAIREGVKVKPISAPEKAAPGKR